MLNKHAVKVKHEHCPECGTCFIAGFTATDHRCLTTIRPDIADVMRLDMGGTEQQSRHANRTAFYRELKRYGVLLGESC